MNVDSYSTTHAICFALSLSLARAEMETGFDDGREYQTFPQLIMIAKRT